jgi:hypothetical protein
LYPFLSLFRPASVKGGCYVVVAALWVVVSPSPCCDDAGVHAGVRLQVAIPQRWLQGLLRQYAKS